MKISKLIYLLVALSLPLYGSTQTELKNPNGISAKVLLIDYGSPNSVDGLDRTFGIELQYQRLLSKYFGVAVPLKIGVADVFGDTHHRNITSIDGLLHIHPLTTENKIDPFLLGGVGYVLENAGSGNVQIPLGVGLNYQLGQNSYLVLQGEYRKSQEENRNNIQLGVGYCYRFGKGDRDHDGIVDAEDACPDTFGLLELAGCPDKDGDGITDGDDVCPDVPGLATANGCPDTDGDGLSDHEDACPDVAGIIMGCPDSDEDGVIDSEDDCPLIAGTAATNGCPDTDGDGMHDGVDRCPEEAGPLFNSGCPQNDRDNDGVRDEDDRCPDTAGPYAGCPDSDNDGVIDPDDRCPEEAGLVTNKGCPEIKEETKEVLDFAMKAVQFHSGSSNLTDDSYDILDQIVDIMGQYPAYSLRIEGHTDNRGEKESNQVLSEERARACYQYLISKGVSPSRLAHLGFGEDYPIVGNDTAADRETNRRVQFEMVLE